MKSNTCILETVETLPGQSGAENTNKFMIEVEKKFQPTEEQLRAMLEGAEFLGEVVNHDVYYDYSDYRLFKKDVRLRRRNKNFELKIKISDNSSDEIENEEDIKKYFNVNEKLEEFVKKNLVVIIEYKTTRREYKKDGFIIDIDKLSFGVSSCDIELLVHSESEIKDAEKKIINFAKKYNFEFKKLLSKRAEYLKRFKPEIYKKLYEEK